MSRDFSGMANAFSGRNDGLDDEIARLIERRATLLGPAYRLFYEEPLHAVRGEGVWLFDRAGKRYLDAYNNVVSIGHCHPHVVEAIARQATVLNTHTRYLHETILDYAERLVATFPPSLDRVMFTCSGSESNDLALRIAQACTGRTGVIVTEHAYHGVTQALVPLSPANRSNETLPPHVEMVPSPGRFLNETDPGAAFAASVERAIERLTERGVRIAAMLCDTLFSSDGLYPDPAGFLLSSVKTVQAAGGLFIADEVQAGFGRTGTAMWGFARHGTDPDIVTLGKPMGNGHPVGGVVMRSDRAEEFGRRTRYFNTFAGNPVSMAAALATIEVIQDIVPSEHANAASVALSQGFAKLKQDQSAIGDVRGTGFFWAVDIVADGNKPDGERASDIVNNMYRNGVLISAVGPHANILKVRPPLILSADEANMIVDSLGSALSTTVTLHER